MSGGSYDYAFQRVEEFRVSLRDNTPLRAAFKMHLHHVQQAMHDIEWVDSGDYSPGDERDSIRACLASGGTSPEKGKVPSPVSVASPQSNRQHAGEGKTAAEEALITGALDYLKYPGSFPHQMALICNIEKVAAERAPLVGREREPQPDLSDQIAMGMEKGRKLAEEAKKIRHGGGTLT